MGAIITVGRCIVERREAYIMCGMLATVLGASALVMLVSLSGKLITWRGVGPLIERNLHFFVSFAAGVLLVVAASLSLEIVEHAGSLNAGLPWIALGAVVVLIAFRYIPNFHHHHDRDGHAHSFIDANRVVASDAIHNVGDGIVIVASFSASPFLGIVSTISILVHEMLQEISEFFVLREAGLSVRSALVYNFAASSTIFIGAIGGYLLLGSFEMLEVPLLGLAAGAYLVVVFNDLIPHSIASSESRKHLLQHIVFFAVGLTAMAGISYMLPHAEATDEHGVALASAYIG